MKQVNIHAAKTHLSSLIEEAVSGESFVIAKAGRPLVVVSPYVPPEKTARSGFLKDQISIPADFDKIGTGEISDLFEGGEK